MNPRSDELNLRVMMLLAEKLATARRSLYGNAYNRSPGEELRIAVEQIEEACDRCARVCERRGVA